MKIRDLRLDDSISVDVRDIPIDTVFSGIMGGTVHGGTSSIFVRAFGVIVDLGNPRNTWVINNGLSHIAVSDYQPLNAQLVVGSVLKVA